jgi:hypothetical protein
MAVLNQQDAAATREKRGIRVKMRRSSFPCALQMAGNSGAEPTTPGLNETLIVPEFPFFPLLRFAEKCLLDAVL